MPPTTGRRHHPPNHSPTNHRMTLKTGREGNEAESVKIEGVASWRPPFVSLQLHSLSPPTTQLLLMLHCHRRVEGDDSDRRWAEGDGDRRWAEGDGGQIWTEKGDDIRPVKHPKKQYVLYRFKRNFSKKAGTQQQKREASTYKHMIRCN
ncbi:unnamed protein product [Lactuca virosa]|uniref:Uncharacterized protein n=1 Tax=Lactuca virosa TaxID=75947 RepID=A0AAU9PER7_9ASTR|nr:unnamed protein product [Lactuca virosa]